MSNPGQDKVTVRVEVVIEGGRTSSVEMRSSGRLKGTYGYIKYPTSASDNTPIVRQTGGKNYIEAYGDSPMYYGAYPSRVWALAYPTKDVDPAAHPKPDGDALSTFIDKSTGNWSFLLRQSQNNPVPNANCCATPCPLEGDDNSTLLVWWDCSTSSSMDIRHVEAKHFYGYCPGSGGWGLPFTPGRVAVGSQHLPRTLHATFTEALAKLGRVTLTWNGVRWVGESIAGGSLVSLLCHDGMFELMSAGPGAAFIVAGQPTVHPRFHWSVKGTALGTLSGHFGVTLTE
ncbi:MAG TPA: hypothetical protein VH643_31150 [Gemmataceae bacterium]|jgi:hypothetical protein